MNPTSPPGDSQRPLFDDLAMLARQIAGASGACVTVSHGGRHHIHGGCGLSADETETVRRCCEQAVLAAETVTVVEFPKPIAFFAGASFPVTADSRGVLAVVDRVPRRLTREMESGLAVLARQAAALCEIRDSEERFRALVEGAPNAILMADRGGRIRLANSHAEALFGYGPYELTGTPIENLVPERFRRSHGEMRSGFFQAPRARSMGAGRDLYGLRKNGTEVPIEIGLNPISTREGNFVVASIIDITERKLAENALRESEKRFRALADAAPVLIWMTGPDGACTYVNHTWEQFTGRPLEAELGGGWLDRVHPEDAAGFTGMRGGEPVSRKFRLQRQDGAYRWISDSGVPRSRPDGAFAGHIGAGIDITDMVAAEETLQAALSEKETLLREIHHRVKNNMQVISSILELQKGHFKEPRYAELLQECQQRVRAMALVHERLHHSRNLATIDFAEHARELTMMVDRVYGRRSVQIHVAADTVILDLDTAIPLGLILNELVSNSLKHAFPHGRAGTVDVRLAIESQGRLLLSVRDDGVGLPPEFDWDNAKSLGLRMIRSLARQIRADVEVKQQAGTEVLIRAGCRAPEGELL